MGALAFTVTIGSPTLGTASSIEDAKAGVTWSFASPVTYGRYWNDDIFVVSGGDTDIVITSIAPASAVVDGAQVNGTMVQPTDSDGRSFDSDATGYNAASNVDPGKTGSSLTIAAATYPTGASVVKAVSLPVADKGSLSVNAGFSVLTIVPSAPAANSFRPPVVGTDKASYYTTDDVDMTLFKSVTAIGGRETLVDFAHMEKRTFQSWVTSSAEARNIQPCDYHTNYGGTQNNTYAKLLATLHTDYPSADKELLAYTMVQAGLDIIASVDSGAGVVWSSESSHNDDGKVPATMAAALLGDASLRASNLAGQFGDDKFIVFITADDLNTDYYYPFSDNGRPGTGAIYYDDFLGYAERISETAKNPDIRTPYRMIHHDYYALTTLGISMLGTTEGAAAWDHDAGPTLGGRIYHMQKVQRFVAGNTASAIDQVDLDFLTAYFDTYHAKRNTDYKPEPVEELTITTTSNSATITFAPDVYIGSGTLVQRDIRYSTDLTNWTEVNDFTDGGTVTGLTPDTIYYFQGRYRSSIGTGPWSDNQIREKNSVVKDALTAAGFGAVDYETALTSVHTAASGYEQLCLDLVRGTARTDV